MKKLIVEVDDKYADAVSLTAAGLEHRLGGGVNLTIAAVALKYDVTVFRIDDNGTKIDLESKFEDSEHISLERLQKAAKQLKDLRYGCEALANHDKSFVNDIEAIDTAITAMQQLAVLNIAENR